MFCDNYLELAKDRLYNPGNYHKGARNSAQFTLYEVLLTILKLLAPILPHVTEEIYQLYFAKNEDRKSIHVSAWPEYNKKYIDTGIEQTVDCVVNIVSAVRKAKSEKALSLNTELKTLVIECSTSIRKSLELVLQDLKAVTKANNIEFGKGNIEVSKELKVKVII